MDATESGRAAPGTQFYCFPPPPASELRENRERERNRAASTLVVAVMSRGQKFRVAAPRVVNLLWI